MEGRSHHMGFHEPDEDGDLSPPRKFSARDDFEVITIGRKLIENCTWSYVLFTFFNQFYFVSNCNLLLSQLRDNRIIIKLVRIWCKMNHNTLMYNVIVSILNSKLLFSPPKNIYIYQFAFFQIQFLHRSRYHATINQFIFTLHYHYIHIYYWNYDITVHYKLIKVFFSLSSLFYLNTRTSSFHWDWRCRAAGTVLRISVIYP